MPKADSAFARSAAIYDTTIGWRFVNARDEGRISAIDSMPETAENVAEQFHVSREDQDEFAARKPAPRRRRAGQWPPRRRDRPGRPSRSARATPSSSTPTSTRALTSLDKLAAAEADRAPGGTITAGNASGRQRRRGGADHRLGSERSSKYGLTPRARSARRRGRRGRSRGSWASAPRRRARNCSSASASTIADIDVVELNEAFAAQGLAGAAHARPCRRRPPREPQWRRDRARPSARHVGRAPRADRDRGTAAQRRPLRALPPCASASARASRSRSNGCRLACRGHSRDHRRSGDHGGARRMCRTPKSRSSRSSTSASCAGSPTIRRGCWSARPTPAARRRSRSSMRSADALDDAGMARRADRARAVPAVDDRMDHRARAPAAPRLRHRPAERRPRPRPARNADRPTPSRSAASAPPRARRSGAATPASSRSSGSNAIDGGTALRVTGSLAVPKRCESGASVNREVNPSDGRRARLCRQQPARDLQRRRPRS